MVKKIKKQARRLGTGLSQLLVKDEELASIIKKPGRRKKIIAGEIKKNIKKTSFIPKDTSNQSNLPIHIIFPGKYQPRKNFDNREIDELATSIKENGILQPILVRPINNNKSSYEIIAGERRWRAAQIAKLHEVPVIIRSFDDETSLGVALIENLQRSDLNMLEEADGYKMLMNKFEYTQERLSTHLGKSRSHVANVLRLLGLPKQIKKLMIMGEISYGHARSLVTLDHNIAVEIANDVSLKGLSVRATERLVNKLKNTKKNSQSILEKEDPNVKALEKELTSLLGIKVKVNHNVKGKGSLQLFYDSLDQLEPIIDKLRWIPR